MHASLIGRGATGDHSDAGEDRVAALVCCWRDKRGQGSREFRVSAQLMMGVSVVASGGAGLGINFTFCSEIL